MSEPISVVVTSLAADTVKVDGSSSQSVAITNGGGVNVSVGTVSPGNASIVAGTLTINSTTTLPAGTPAYVVNNGTAYAAKLDIGIPTGAAGPAGPAGKDGITPTFSFLKSARRVSASSSRAS